MRTAAALVLVALLAAGCGGDGGNDDGGGTALERAFAATKTTPDLEGGFEFSDTAYLRGYDEDDPMFQLTGYASTYFESVREGFGLQLDAAESALLIGTPPHTGARLEGGQDPEAVADAIIEVGAERGEVAGRDGLTFGEEASVHQEAMDEFGQGPGLGEFARAILEGDTVIAAKYEAEAAALAGEGDGGSLAEDETFSAYADCLGDVVAALGGDLGDGQTLAAGVRRPPSRDAKPQEVLCAVGGDQAALEEKLRALEDPEAQLPSTRTPVSDLWSKVTVDKGAGYVRATLELAPDRAPGVALTALVRGEFSLNPRP